MTEMDQLKSGIIEAVEKVRTENPLAGSVTNGVTMDFVANAQLAVGGSAAMVYLPDEGECLVAAGAFKSGKPWVLDPVGIGIGQLRSDLLLELKQYKPAIVRGNASEIIALASLWGIEANACESSRPRGVDTTDTVEAARDAAAALARYTGGAVAVSGKKDLVTDGEKVVYSEGGSELMEKVTGFGCSQGGVLAVYATATNPFTAALAAVAHYNVAGSRAAKVADAPASFKTAFIDELYRATARDIADNPFSVEEA